MTAIHRDMYQKDIQTRKRREGIYIYIDSTTNTYRQELDRQTDKQEERERQTHCSREGHFKTGKQINRFDFKYIQTGFRKTNRHTRGKKVDQQQFLSTERTNKKNRLSRCMLYRHNAAIGTD